MPPSILKYLDVARLVGAGIQCPACRGTHCRPSRWHSKHEKLGARHCRPYRCHDCTNRFLATADASRERTLINSAAGVLLGLGVLTAGDLWLENFDPQKTGRGTPASTLHSDESTPAIEILGQAGDATSTAGENSAKLVEKLQKAAADGDVDAMVELGRALASGTKLPKDIEQAARWIQLAAATGNAEGMYELGRFYRDGAGLTQDSVRAYLWFSRAAAAHHRAAMQERDGLVRTMSDEKLQAAHQLTLAADPLAENGRRK